MKVVIEKEFHQAYKAKLEEFHKNRVRKNSIGDNTCLNNQPRQEKLQKVTCSRVNAWNWKACKVFQFHGAKGMGKSCLYNTSTQVQPNI